MQLNPGDAERDPQSDDGAGRRAHPRLTCNGVAQLRTLPLGKFVPGGVVDLSIQGCCIDAGQEMCVETHATVEVLLNLRGTSLRLNGVVRHVSQSGRMGIQFLEVSARKQEQIKELIADILDMDQIAMMEKMTSLAVQR